MSFLPLVGLLLHAVRSAITATAALLVEYLNIKCCWCRVKTEVADVTAIVLSDGSVIWIPPINYLVRCQHEDNAITSCSLTLVIPFYK